MTEKAQRQLQFLIGGAVAVLLIVVAYLLVRPEPAEDKTASASPARPSSEAAEGAFLAGVSKQIPEVRIVEISDAESSVTLRKDDEGQWRVVQRSDYYATESSVTSLLRGFAVSGPAEPKTARAEMHGRLGLADPDSDTEGAGRRVVLRTAEGAKPLADVIVGNSGRTRANQQAIYLRETGEDQAYLLPSTLSFTSASPETWIDRTLFSIPISEIRTFTVRTDETATSPDLALTRPEPSAEWVLEDLPSGYRPSNQSTLGTPPQALTSFTFQEIAAEFPDTATTPTLLSVTTFSGLRLEADIRRAGENQAFATFAASYDPSLRPAEAESLPSPDEAQKTADAIARRAKGRVFEIPSWKLQTLLKPKTELMQPANEVSEVAASHILLAYEGAERSEVQGRTREEAKAQAETLLAQLGSGEAQLPDLAREHSDCPSAPSGGDLGTFGRGVMAKAFEDTAFALKVGETSGVVETPFGFHIIQRTQ